MQHHLRRCPACTAQTEAEQSLRPWLTDPAGDFENEAEAASRVTQVWLDVLPEMHARPRRRSRGRRGWLTFSAAVGLAAAVFLVGVVTAPRRAVAQVRDAMARVQRFHLRMELRTRDARYEAWGQRGAGARVDEWEGDRRTMIILDDGQKLRRYSPTEKTVRESPTQFATALRAAANFKASRILRQAARGNLFQGEEWLGKPEARGVEEVRRNGVRQRRIALAVEEGTGMFAKIVLYADVSTDRLAQADLFTGPEDADSDYFARVYFDYPERLDHALLHPKLPKGVRVEAVSHDPALP